MSGYIGQQLGNYRILRLLGEGGFAQVYLGEHIYLKTMAAIKVLLANLADNDLQSFLNEARTVAHLRHPQIVRVLEFGVTAGHVPFLAMAYAPAGTLRQRHPKGMAIPLKDVLVYVNQVATALQFAHDNKLVHRDVKPENMLIGRNGQILLSDFGIAVSAPDTQAQNGEKIGGTVIYMAPEQIDGKPRPASDQYALGVVTYEWLSGTPPFRGSNFLEVAFHHLQTPPVPLRRRVPGLSADIEAVVMRALAKDPAARFPTVQGFAQALEEAGRPHISHVSLSSSATSEHTLAPATIDPSAQTLASPLDTTTPSVTPAPYPVTTPPPVERRERFTRRAVTTGFVGFLGVSAMSGGILWYVRTRPPSQPSPPGLSSSPLPTLPLGTTMTTYGQHTGSITGVSWSPDGDWIASASYDKTVQVWSPAGGAAAKTFIYADHTDKVVAAAWSPNGASIASASNDKTVRVWSAPHSGTGAPGTTRAVYQGDSPQAPVALAWSPDSQRIASTAQTGDSNLQVWDAASGKHAVYYPDPTQNGPAPAPGSPNAVAWSPNGKYIVSSIAAVAVWSVESQSRLLTYNGQNFVIVHGLAWSPDSTRVASAGEDKTVQVWNAATGNTLFTYKGHSDAVHAVAWSPDGRYLASASRDKTVQVWDAATGTHVFTYRGHTAPVNAVAWSRDSRHIVSGGDDKRVLVWQGA